MAGSEPVRGLVRSILSRNEDKPRTYITQLRSTWISQFNKDTSVWDIKINDQA